MMNRWPARAAGSKGGAAVVPVISARHNSAFKSFRLGAAAAMLGLAVPWLVRGPDLRDEQSLLNRQSQQRGREQRELQTRIQALQVQLSAHGADAQPAAPTTAQTRADRLMLHRLALQFKVHLDLLKSNGEGAWPKASADQPSAAGTPQAAVREAALRIELRGSYGALLGFVQALGDSGSPWALRQLQLTAGAQQEHRLSLVLDALPAVSRQVAGADRRLRASAWRGPDPFAGPVLAAAEPVRESEPSAAKDPLADVPEHWRPEFLRERQALEAMPLRELIFTGTLRQGAVWVALMRGRDAVHTIQVGDYLGPELGRVQRIDEDGLDLRELRRDGSGRWAEHLRHWRVGGAP